MVNFSYKKSQTYNIFLLGDGIVEDALRIKILQSKKLKKLYTVLDFYRDSNLKKDYYTFLTNISQEEINKLVLFAKEKNIDIVICDCFYNSKGLINAFKSVGIKAIGVNKRWSKLETFKTIGKKFMQLNNIKTAKYIVVETFEEFKANLEKFKFPLVVKANGPAAGLGVYICEDEEQAINAFEKLKSGDTYPAQKTIIIEEYINGREFVIVSLWDGKTLCPLLPMKDYKLLLEGNKGPNTGSMGTYFPLHIPVQYQNYMEEYLRQLQKALRRYKADFCGAVYSALMVNDKGIHCLEYNMRVGMPEGTLLSLLMRNDIVEIMKAMVNQKLSHIKVEWEEGMAACINIVSKNYPYVIKQKLEANVSAIEKLKKSGINVFKSPNICESDDKITKNGSFFLCLAKSSENPIEEIYEQIESINFSENFTNCQYRKDIGY